MKNRVTKGNRRRLGRFAVYAVMMGNTAVFCAGAKAADYTVGISSRSGGYFEATMKSLWTEAAPVFSKRLGVNLKMRFLPGDGAFEAAIARHELDFAYAINTNTLTSNLKAGYQPLAGVKLLGAETGQHCLYVAAKNTAHQLAEIKNLKAVTYTSESDYYVLRSLLGAKPEAVFSSLRVSPSGQDSLYALALGQSDVAFADKVNEDFFRITNPGPLKKIRRLQCARDRVPFNPLFVHPKVPTAVREKLLKILGGLATDPAFKRFHPLLKRMGFGFYPIQMNGFKPLMALVQKSRAQGWRQDYLAWIKSAKGMR